MKEKHKILIVGCGQMGSGIAQTASEYGYSVFLSDLDEALAEQAVAKIYKRWDLSLEKGKREKGEIDFFKTNLHVSKKDNYKGYEFIIEAVSESERVKKEIFKNIGKGSSKHTILGSNTSSISINTLGEASGFPERVIGIHFMNPVPIMKLVEVIEGDKTSADTIQKTLKFNFHP